MAQVQAIAQGRYVRQGAALSVCRVDACTFLVEMAGALAVIDPWLHDPARIWPLWTAHHLDPPPLHTLPACELLLVSQKSDDHCDLRAIASLPRTTAVAATPHAARRVRPLGFAVKELAWGDTCEIGGFRVTALPAGHDGVPDQNAYLLERAGRSALFLADTALLPALRTALARLPAAPDVVLVAANGFRVRGRGRINMDPEDAARAVAACRARHVVPTRHLSREEARGPLGRALSSWIPPDEAALRFRIALGVHAPAASLHVLDRGEAWTPRAAEPVPLASAT